MNEKQSSMTYIKLFVDYLDAIEELGDAERGRLFTALLEYGRTGAAQDLSGNERYVFPMMRAQIDRDNAAYAELTEKRSEAGKCRLKQKEQMQANAANAGKCSQDKEKENDKDKDEDKDERVAPARTERVEFVPPAVDEVRQYCAERGNYVDPERFVDYYSACGWVVGRNAMQDWKAAVRSWERNGIADEKPKEQSEEGSSFDKDEFFEAAVRHSMERHGKKINEIAQSAMKSDFVG